MRNKNYRLTLELSKLSIATFTIIKSSIMHFFQLKKKRKRTNIHFQTRNLHQKEIKFARTPSKYPFILFPNFPTFILIQTLFSPLRKPSPSHNRYPRPIQSFHEESIADIQYPTSIPNFPPRMSIPYIERGERGGSRSRKPYSTCDLTRNDGWEYIETTRRFRSDAVSRCWYLDSPWLESISRINSAN